MSDPHTAAASFLALALTLAPMVAASLPVTTADPPVTREATCRWAASAPKIDGALDDSVWKSATVIDRLSAFWAGKATPANSATRARLLWDREGLYFAAIMTDSELRAFGAKHNDHLWNGDVFELFLKPSAESPKYYEFQANPNAAMFQVAFPERGARVGRFGDLPPLGMIVAVRLDGTLDKPGDRDGGWTVEGKIPWTAFAPSGGRPEPGAVWSFALCRYDYGPDGTQPVLMSSAPLEQPNFHRHENYGRLTFEGPRP